MFVKPNPDKKVNGKALEVYDPTRREFLPPEGRDVPRSSYWMRRIQTGDVVRADAATESQPASDGDKNKNGGSASTAKSKTKAKTQAEKQKTAKKNSSSAPKQDNAATESKGE